MHLFTILLKRPLTLLLLLAGIWITFSTVAGAEERSIPAKSCSALNYPSIQAALNANPGKIITVPPGDYTINEKLLISSVNGGLEGAGRIIQSNPKQPIIEIASASGVTLSGLTLTRAAGAENTESEAVVANRCPDLSIMALRILDNRTRSSAIAVAESDGVRIIGCRIVNYMRLAIDDRTASPDYGYAFNCIDGTGITVRYCGNVLIQNNRVVEHDFVPTRELKEKYGLGKFVKKNPTKGRVIGQKTWDEEYTNAWHQGSGILVDAPEVADAIQILGNSVENAAQGIDIHADHVIVSQNIIRNAFMGMKAMHGSRNVLIIGNQFYRNDLWSIGLMPGAASHAALAASAGKPAKADNSDGSSIVANNIISNFGEGSAAWMWADQGTPMRFDDGQLPENPPLTDVIIQGNIIQTSSVPHYRYAVRINSEVKGLHFSNNLFSAGTDGISNAEMKP